MAGRVSQEDSFERSGVLSIGSEHACGDKKPFARRIRRQGCLALLIEAVERLVLAPLVLACNPWYLSSTVSAVQNFAW